VVRAVDLDTGDVSPDIPVGDAPVGIAVDGDEVWVTNSGAGDHTVMRIDANSGEVDLTVELEAGSSLSGIALTDDHVWVSRGGRTDISQLDRTTGEELQIISEEPGFGGSGIVQLLVTDDGLWAVDRWCGRVVQIDTDTGDIAAVYDDLGYESTEPETCTGGVGAEGPLRNAEFEGGIFVLQQVVTDEGLQTGRISRIDPDTEEVQTLTDVPFNPGTVIPIAVPALVVEDGGIWLTSGDQAVRMTREGGRFDGVFSGSTTSIVALIEVDGKVWYAVSDRNGELSGLYGIDTDEATEAAA
jgi:DNA-binding beta-propeller fold protein YncE